MGENPQLRGRLRFGVFELDLRAGELRKHGLRVRLQEQPFQVLAMLLEHPGEVVTREEVQKTIWPADTFVDFDHGLNKAINKIREALGDSPRVPALWRLLLVAATASSRRSKLPMQPLFAVRTSRLSLLPRQNRLIAPVSLANSQCSKIFSRHLRGRYQCSYCSS